MKQIAVPGIVAIAGGDRALGCGCGTRPRLETSSEAIAPQCSSMP